jgi:DNA-directed RNA polymerase sigma subunit (sigma70/sigma32)
MNLTRERIRQVETRGLLKLRAIAEDEPRARAAGDHEG